MKKKYTYYKSWQDNLYRQTDNSLEYYDKRSKRWSRIPSRFGRISNNMMNGQKYPKNRRYKVLTLEEVFLEML